ncbi:MAG: ComEA family DNA-binding protein [Gemmatimonadota bacterium]|nr:ComEA family DNA-binding protein [Gemmatimonadota bacterium]
MATADDRRAAMLLLGLALAGMLVRLAVGGSQPAGAIAYGAVDSLRPMRDSLAARAARLARPLGPGERIDVDVASAEDLTRLPRIGAGLAARIVADRDTRGAFGTLDQLERVPGIGPGLLEAVRPHATFSGRSTHPGTDRRGRVRVNTATQRELETLPGIGPVRAAEIVADRRLRGPYRRLEDLQRVPGIGPQIVERLRNSVQIP